jgi:hypothetical protein
MRAEVNLARPKAGSFSNFAAYFEKSGVIRRLAGQLPGIDFFKLLR